MKSLTDVKRRMTVGTPVHVDHFECAALTRDTEVVHVQKNAIVTRMEPRPGNERGWSWCYWPKASEVRIERDTITFLTDAGEPHYAYTILADWQVGAREQVDGDGNVRVEIAECGTCGRTWNDALITSMTPAPSGRCPFEHWHGL